MARMGKARDLPEFQFVGPLEMSRNQEYCSQQKGNKVNEGVR
jgi:hypothetical protein